MVASGLTAEFHCNVTAPLEAGAVAWFHNGVAVAASASASRYSLPLAQVLRVAGVGPADAGVYQCFPSASSAPFHAARTPAAAELVVRGDVFFLFFFSSSFDWMLSVQSASLSVKKHFSIVQQCLNLEKRLSLKCSK